MQEFDTNVEGLVKDFFFYKLKIKSEKVKSRRRVYV